jgi:hypothetical protein
MALVTPTPTPAPVPAAVATNPTGTLAQTLPGFDPEHVINAHEANLADYLNQPVQDILARLGLNSVRSVAPGPASNGGSPTPSTANYATTQTGSRQAREDTRGRLYSPARPAQTPHTDASDKSLPGPTTSHPTTREQRPLDTERRRLKLVELIQRNHARPSPRFHGPRDILRRWPVNKSMPGGV